MGNFYDQFSNYKLLIMNKKSRYSQIFSVVCFFMIMLLSVSTIVARAPHNGDGGGNNKLKHNSRSSLINTSAIAAAPAITAGSSIAICSGGSVVLTAAPVTATDLDYAAFSIGTQGVDQWQSFAPTILQA